MLPTYKWLCVYVLPIPNKHTHIYVVYVARLHYTHAHIYPYYRIFYGDTMPLFVMGHMTSKAYHRKSTAAKMLVIINCVIKIKKKEMHIKNC